MPILDLAKHIVIGKKIICDERLLIRLNTCTLMHLLLEVSSIRVILKLLAIIEVNTNQLISTYSLTFKILGIIDGTVLL